MTNSRDEKQNITGMKTFKGSFYIKNWIEYFNSKRNQQYIADT